MKKITIQHFGLNELTSLEINQINGGDNITQKIFNWFGKLYSHIQNGQEAAYSADSEPVIPAKVSHLI